MEKTNRETNKQTNKHSLSSACDACKLQEGIEKGCKQVVVVAGFVAKSMYVVQFSFCLFLCSLCGKQNNADFACVGAFFALQGDWWILVSKFMLATK